MRFTCWKKFPDSHPDSASTEALMNPPRLKLHPFHRDPGRHCKLHTQLIRAITGHGRHASYLFKCRKVDSPACPCGAPKQNVHHIFVECPRVSLQIQPAFEPITHMHVLYCLRSQGVPGVPCCWRSGHLVYIRTCLTHSYVIMPGRSATGPPHSCLFCCCARWGEL